MGMRQNIKLVYSESIVDKPESRVVDEKNVIYIYSHWGGGEGYGESSLAQSLKAALSRRERWEDESYLARIIISEVLKDEIGDATGFGLAPYEVDPQFETIVVDLASKTVDGIPFEKFIDINC